ncbi:MAG: hypothetical protein H5U33_21930, partial [Pseudomonas sp.]|nr:hypothetical protein [Pseudomonas sp.]
MNAVTSFPASVSGNDDFARIISATESSTPQTLTLQGTLADGTPGKVIDVPIEPATVASISAGNSYDVSQKLTGIGSGFQNGDQIIVNYTNSYTGKEGSFTITVDDAANRDIYWLQTQFGEEAENAGIKDDVEMYIDVNAGPNDDEIIFRT